MYSKIPNNHTDCKLCYIQLSDYKIMLNGALQKGTSILPRICIPWLCPCRQNNWIPALIINKFANPVPLRHIILDVVPRGVIGILRKTRIQSSSQESSCIGKKHGQNTGLRAITYQKPTSLNICEWDQMIQFLTKELFFLYDIQMA